MRSLGVMAINMEKEITDKFSELMLKKIELRHNRYAPMGWETMDTKRLITLLKGELLELEEALGENDKSHVQDEALDVANYAMFLWHKNQ